MILKHIRLNNIRSYLNQEVSFPTGSTLLAGDIGSGKSSILVAIEFALFGLKKGELSSESLLRHGAKEGSVELNFEIEGKDIRIKRILKRVKDEIRNEGGYIIVGNKKREATAEELKAIILELLGYPKEYLKKRDLIYRYTLYTPQEEMKKIIYENKDVRLDALRKVFNVDKYKRIIENTKFVTTALRDKRTRLEGFVNDLVQKKNEAGRINKEIIELEEKILPLIPLLEQTKLKLESKKDSIAKYEERIDELNALRRDYQILESRINQDLHQVKLNESDVERVNSQIDMLKKEVENGAIGLDITIHIEHIKAKEKEIKIFEAHYKEALKNLHSLKAKNEQLKDSIDKITNLEICPVCEQKVTNEHKHYIRARDDLKLKSAEEEIRQYSETERELDEKIQKIKEEIEKLRGEEIKLNVIRIKKKNLEDKITERERLKKELGGLKIEIAGIIGNKQEIFSKIEKMQFIGELYRNSKHELEQMMKEERKIELEKVALERERNTIKKGLLMLNKEIEEKNKALKELQSIAELGNWIDNFFVKLISTIERHVMHSLHSQFNDLLREWFNIILEDETINVRIDEEFTPVIEQNGYETGIENLSGGERTSVALSYRLALNKVINDIVSEIKTKNMIILDEPTDGFSTEQLDKIRDVLKQLNMQQIIIVSHESKIESYVDNVIRVSKNEHISRIE